MKIFLADTVHNSAGFSPNTVPYNVARIAAFCQSKHGDLSYTIFKDPRILLSALKIQCPDILALSNYFWNTRLNHRIASYAKSLFPNILIVTGGPNLNRDRDAYEIYAIQNSFVDFVIVDEGETSFEALIDKLHHKDRNTSIMDIKMTEIPGTFAIINPGIYLSASRPRVKSLDEFPSPYLNGMLDSFLDQGMSPIVEFIRGCPYTCAFCEQGSSFFNKLAKLAPARVYEEVEYVRQRDKTGQLIVADVNFGIVERDVEIAKFLKASFLDKNWPSKLYLYNAKVPSQKTLDCMEILHPMAALSMSFQSTNSQVLKNIHRSNIGMDKYSFITKWAKDKLIPVGTELIYGLPGETRKTFLDGYEALLGMHADFMSSYNLRLFDGMELNRPDVRKRYKFQTRFRPMDINFGEYQFDSYERLIEIEEIVFTTSTLNEADFFHTRRIAFMIEAFWNTGYLRPALIMLAKHGHPVLSVFDKILTLALGAPEVNNFFAEYERLIKEELEESPSIFKSRISDDEYWNNLISGRSGNMKINLAFSGMLLFFENKMDDFFYSTIFQIGSTFTSNNAEFFEDILSHCKAGKINFDHPDVKQINLIYDIPAWCNESYPDDISRFRLANHQIFSYSISNSLISSATKIKERLSRNGASLSFIAERMMMELPIEARTMRNIKRSAEMIVSTNEDSSRMIGRMSWS